MSRNFSLHTSIIFLHNSTHHRKKLAIFQIHLHSSIFIYIHLHSTNLIYFHLHSTAFICFINITLTQTLNPILSLALNPTSEKYQVDRTFIYPIPPWWLRYLYMINCLLVRLSQRFQSSIHDNRWVGTEHPCPLPGCTSLNRSTMANIRTNYKTKCPLLKDCFSSTTKQVNSVLWRTVFLLSLASTL